MQRQYTFAVQAIGTQKEISPGDFQIARVAVDNPSGCWLYLSIVNAYIPPQTLGWVIPFQPAQTRVDVQFVNAPTGGIPSAITGGPIVVTAYDSTGFAVTGTDFGLLPAVIDLTAAIAALETAIKELNAGTGTDAAATYGQLYLQGTFLTGVPYQDGSAIAPQAGKRIFLRRISCQVVLPINGFLYPFLHVPFTLIIGSGSVGTIIWQANGDGEGPLDITFDPDTVGSATGQDIALLLDALPDGSAGLTPDYNLLIEYYYK